MIYVKNNELKLADKKIVFEKNGVQKEKEVGPEGVEWWNGLADQHENIEIIEVVDVTYTQEKLDRFEKTKNFKTNLEEVEEYVETGNIESLKTVENDKIKNFVLEKENKELEGVIDDLTQVLIDKGVIY